ncbi:MAG: T9SS type A sorting domain-containing protein [Ignavibacterium sp.]|nr:MAG: T9SS type A sorting domain-containing protein [Ignavibacterium sp.]
MYGEISQPSDTSEDDTSAVIITDFFLSQNYPNPFNPLTRIQYTVNNTKFVTLKVYDVLGGEIATLINEEKSAGEYKIEFDGAGLSSGIYFYRLQAGSFVETKKMVLLK